MSTSTRLSHSEAAIRCHSDLSRQSLHRVQWSTISCILKPPLMALFSMSRWWAPLSPRNHHHHTAISTIIVLIILSTVKSYSALGTDVNSTATTVATGAKPDLHEQTSNSTEQWTQYSNVTVTSVSSVSTTVANLSLSAATEATIGSNPLEINGSASINNSTLSTGDQWHHNQSDLISHLHCEYGTVRKYSFTSVVQSRLAGNGSIRASFLVRCLHQVTWGIGEQQDKLNGQKYLVYINDFHTDALDSSDRRPRNKNAKVRFKRGVYQYFEHLWSDFKSILPFEEEESSHHDDFDQDLLRSMESELQNKCHSLMFWEEFQSLHHQGLNKCIHCHANPLSKFSLPFWFIQLEDGSIPQIRFTKQEINLEVKNFKKLITSLLATQLNSSNFDSIETTVLGVHHSHYRTLNQSVNSESSAEDISQEQTVIVKHIEPQDFIIEQNKELHFWIDKLPLNISAKQVQQIDLTRNQIISSRGTVKSLFGPAELSQYSSNINEHSLQREEVTSHKVADLMNELQESYLENQKEKLVAEPIKEEALLQEKYTDALYRLRNKLGRTEYHYYNKLFECATCKAESPEYNALLELVVLEQQLNHTMHQHNSLIGDIRRIGTTHNIQLVCGNNLIKLDSEKCSSFLSLLLESSSKTAQRLLLYTVQNQSKTLSAKATTAVRMLAQTYQAAHWLVEGLAHETHHHASNREIETILLQTLVLLAQREQLVRLKELLSTHLVKRIRDTLQESVSAQSELYTIDLLEMLANLDNFTALQSVQEVLDSKWHASDLVTIATIHAYRRSINRSQVQNQFGKLFLSSNSCQIKQQIVQQLIDDSDLLFWQQTRDKKWPKYGFEQLDYILANELRNSSNNCVHHLIVEYFKRKQNSIARKLVAEFEMSQNYNASSFDFCINEHFSYKCDYVQTLGNELSSVEMRKSISISKPQLESLNTNNEIEWRHWTYSYTRHSLSALIYKYKLTVAHLSVIQMRLSSGQSQMRVQLQTHHGIIIPLVNFEVNKQLEHRTVRIAQSKLTIPVKVACTEHSLQADNTLLVQMNAFFAVYLQTEQTDLNRTVPVLQIQISLQHSGELLYSGLALQQSIDLQTKFEYQSKQPIEIWPSNGQTNVSTEQNGNNLIRLGREKFYSQIELWHYSNKHYDAQCNIWMDQSGREQLTHWNSTVKQSNLFTLPLQPLMLPINAQLTTEHTARNQLREVSTETSVQWNSTAVVQ